MDHHFAVNKIKFQRAVAASKGDDSKVYDLYVNMGGKVQKGYEKEIPFGDVVMCEEMTIDGEGTIDQEGNVETTQVIVKKRGRPFKNAQ